jgi:hypothetical protein
MATYRMQLYFDGPAAGASEQYDFQSLEAGVDDVQSEVQAVYDKRCLMLADDWSGVGYRITRFRDDDGTPILREAQFYFRPGRGAPPPNVTWDSAPVDTAVKGILYGQRRRASRPVFLAGFPKQVTQDGYKVRDNDSGWLAAFESFRQQLFNLALGWYRSSLKSPSAVVGYDVTDIGVVTVHLAEPLEDAPVGAARFQVRLTGVNNKSELNGLWTATNYSNTSQVGVARFDLVPRFGVVPWNGGGMARVQADVWTPVGINAPVPNSQTLTTSFIPFVIAKRQRGAPFAAGRGRAPARIRT